MPTAVTAWSAVCDRGGCSKLDLNRQLQAFLAFCRRHAPTRLCSAVLTDQQDSSVTAIADAASRLSANAEHTIQNLEASTSSSVSQGGNWSKTLLEQLVPVQAVAAETVQAPQVPESLQQQSPANQARNWIQAPVEQLNPPVQAPQLPDTAPTVDQARELFKASVKQLESAQKAATEAPQGTESVQQPPPAAHWGTEQLKSLHAPHIPDSVQQLVTGYVQTTPIAFATPKL